MEPADALDTRQVQARKPPDRDAGTAPPFLRPGMAVRLQRGRVHRRVQRRGDPLPLPRQHHTGPLDTGTSPGLMTGGQDTWSARCVETRTAGAAGGPGKPTGSNPGRAPWSDPTGEFNRSEMYPLLERINTYLMRWARKKYKRLRTWKRFKAWWRGLTEQWPCVKPRRNASTCGDAVHGSPLTALRQGHWAHREGARAARALGMDARVPLDWMRRAE